MQKTSKNGKPMINRLTKLPIYTNSVERRIREISKQLFNGMSKQDMKWAMIQNSVKALA